MAVIQQRGEAQWRAQIRASGRAVARSRSRTFKTHEAAERWADVIEGRIGGEDYIDRSKERRATREELVDRYEREVSPGKKDRTAVVCRLPSWASTVTLCDGGRRSRGPRLALSH